MVQRHCRTRYRLKRNDLPSSHATRSVRFTDTNQELGSVGSSWVRGAKLKFGKLGTSYLVAVRLA